MLRKAQAPSNLTASKEASHFLAKHHTTVVKIKEPTPIQEIVIEMEAAKDTADLQLLPDRLAAADAIFGGPRKSLRMTNNPNTLTFMGSVKASMEFNAAILRELSLSVTELAQLHILSATDHTDTNTFARKWAKYLGTKVLKTRNGVFRCVVQWRSNPDTSTIARVTRALSVFELMLLCTAPNLLKGLLAPASDWIVGTLDSSTQPTFTATQYVVGLASLQDRHILLQDIETSSLVRKYTRRPRAPS